MIEELQKAVRRLAHNPIQNYVLPGLKSEVIGGFGHGMVRLLTSERDTREFVAPHSHRFGFTCFVLAGAVHNTIYATGGPERWAKSVLRLAPLGSADRYILDRPVDVNNMSAATYWSSTSRVYGPGETYSMRACEIHSISFARGASVLFFEGPEETQETVVLEPLVDGRIVPTFKVEPWMFEPPALE